MPGTLLVVDDEPQILQAVSGILQDEGFEVLTAADGEAALKMVGEQDPGTPVDAARAMHERIRGSHLEVIPSSAHLSNIEQTDVFNKALTKFLSGP